jgi:C_GCAxxG_C_C family probable redox protein
MWEAYDLQNEDLLWAAIPFMGGISGHQQAPCGVVSSSAVCLSFRHRCSLQDKEKAKKARNKIRTHAGDLVKAFEKEFGTIVCRELVGLNLSNPLEYLKFSESAAKRDRCNKAIEFGIDKLYEFEQRDECKD